MTASVDALLAAQNPDGGWGYGGGGSWTEPTTYALLALEANGVSGAPAERGIHWLVGLRRPDGGWAPRAGVDESTWVTALAALVLARRPVERRSLMAAQEWLLARSGKESTFLYRLRQRLLRFRPPEEDPEGWPWFPDTAAWVTPTALSIVALGRGGEAKPGRAGERIQAGRRYLLARMCRDGGWNHGSSRALGYEAASYPETTGIGLLAFHGSPAPELSKAVAAAQRHLAECRSLEAWSWLTLGLRAHGRSPRSQPPAPPRTVMETALLLLAEAAGRGRHAFTG